MLETVLVRSRNYGWNRNRETLGEVNKYLEAKKKKLEGLFIKN